MSAASTVNPVTVSNSAQDPVLSDALVFFGATGDLAYEQIFPALQAMAKHGNLDFPIIGVAARRWSLDQLRARAKESVEKPFGGCGIRPSKPPAPLRFW